VECLLFDKEEISSHSLSKGTFFSFVFDLQATLTTNYHKNKNTKCENKEKKRGASLKAQLFVQVYKVFLSSCSKIVQESLGLFLIS